MSKDNPNILERLNNISIGRPGSLLAFFTDGFNLHGALIHAGLGGQQVQAAGTSAAVDYRNAVADVISQLRDQGMKKPPRKAALISTSAISALVWLPVKADTLRPREQMQELVRWELEPLYAMQGNQWRLGALLMGRGCMTREQRIAVVEARLANKVQGADLGSNRFGELAIEMGFVSKEHVDECLALQEKLIHPDDDIVCGWSPQEPPEADAETDSVQSPWLVAGIGRSYLNAWASAFRRNKLSLEWLYPALGAGFASLDKKVAGDFLYVDVAQEQMSVMHGRPGAVSSVRTVMLDEGRASVEQISGLCRDECGADTHHVYVNGSSEALKSLTPELTEVLVQDVFFVSSEGAPAQ